MNSSELSRNTAFHEERAKFVDLLYSSEDMLPRRYVFVLTNSCNLNCDFCPQSKTVLDYYMTAKDWISLLDHLPPYAAITLTGGEPLLSPDFEEVFSEVASRFPCNVITNGLLINSSLLEMMLSFGKLFQFQIKAQSSLTRLRLLNVLTSTPRRLNPRRLDIIFDLKLVLQVLSLSIDDVGGQSRKMSPHQWDTLVNNTRSIREIRNKLQAKTIFDIKTLITDENAASLAKIHRYCIEELKCDTHCFQFLKGNPYQHSDTMVKFEAVEREDGSNCYTAWDTICEQMELVNTYNSRMNRSSYCHPKIFDLNHSEPVSNDSNSIFNAVEFDSKLFQQCKAPWESMHINADGTVFPCLSIEMGNVRKQTLKQIFFSEEYTQFRSVIKSRHFPACRRCGSLQKLGDKCQLN